MELPRPLGTLLMTLVTGFIKEQLRSSRWHHNFPIPRFLILARLVIRLPLRMTPKPRTQYAATSVRVS
eukprot:1805134-Amphidinium_carterae.1